MQPLDTLRYQQLREGAQVLEADSFGDKVLRLADGNFLKLFRRKRLLSSALLRPYAQRFADNTCTLERLGIPCPQVIAVYRAAALKRDLVHYRPLPGLTLRQLMDGQGESPTNMHEQLGAFIATLHHSGIYFRSLHLGNIVLTPQGQLGLIDVADLKHQRRSLNKQQRLRNFQHMLRDERDSRWLQGEGKYIFLDAYRKISGLTIEL